MKNKIDNLLNFTLLNIESSQRIKKDNLPLLECYIKKTSSSTYTIIDTIKKNCIKCYFNAQSQIQMNILSELDRKNIMKISIAKYSFDYLLVPKNNEIFSSIVIVIDTFSLSEEESNITLKGVSDINKNELIITKRKEQCDLLIKKILNEYYSTHINEDISADFFMKKKNDIKEKKNQSIFNMIKELYTLSDNAKGVLLQCHIEINKIDDYLLDDFFDYEYIESSKKINSVNWKSLYQIMPTNNESNKEDVFIPKTIDIKSFVTPKEFEKEKDSFLNRKKKRYNFCDSDYHMPSKIQSLISQYGNVHTNIGSAFIEKYQLYKRYNALRESSSI